MILTILGKRYKLRFVHSKELKRGELIGDCDKPTAKQKEIRLWCGLKKHPRELMKILIHECTHAADWGKDEEWITQFAEDLERILYRIGFRNTIDNKKEDL